MSPVSIVLAACVFASGGIVFYLVWPGLSHDSTAIVERLAGYGINPRTWPLLAVYFCVVNSTLEEFFWRGCLMSERRLPRLDDFAFAGYHVFVLLAFVACVWAPPVFAACALAGWLWRRLRMATGSLVVPIVTHVIADTSIAVEVHLRVFA